MKKAHLIGNGPSKQYFSLESEGHLYGCNFASEDLNLKATFIHDNRVFEHIIRHDMKLKWPVVNRINQHSRYGDCGGRIKVLDTFYPNPGETTCSSGHMGILWLMGKDYRQIDLWGFDSILSNIVDSDSKGKIDGSAPNPLKLPEWEKRYNQIFFWCKKYGIKVIAHGDGSTKELS